MKKFLQFACTLALVAGSAVSASAQSEASANFFVNDFTIQKGEEKEVAVYLLNPDYGFSAMQFDIVFTGGITFVTEEDGTPWIDPNTDRIPGVSGRGASYMANGNWQPNNTTERNHYRYLFYNSKGLYVDSLKTATPDAPLFYFTITTDDTFGTTDEPIGIHFYDVKLSDPHSTVGLLCDTKDTKVYEALELAEFNATPCTRIRYIANPVKVMGKSTEMNGKQYVFVTDGADNWMKLEASAEEASALEEGATFDGCQLGGVLTGDVNPSIKMATSFGYEKASTAITTEVRNIDMTKHFELKTNEVVTLKAYYFNDDDQQTMRAYSGAFGARGQSLTVDGSWCPGGNQMENANYYTIKKAAVQIKEAWDNNDANRVAPSDELAFQNYTIYPLSMAEIATGVNDINVNKGVASVRYYNIAGVEAAEPFSGVNMVVTTYTDGTTTTTKVIK